MHVWIGHDIAGACVLCYISILCMHAYFVGFEYCHKNQIVLLDPLGPSNAIQGASTALKYVM